MTKARWHRQVYTPIQEDLLKLRGTFGKEEGIIFLGEGCPYMSVYKKKILCIDTHGIKTRSS